MTQSQGSGEINSWCILNMKHFMANAHNIYIYIGLCRERHRGQLLRETGGYPAVAYAGTFEKLGVESADVTAGLRELQGSLPASRLFLHLSFLLSFLLPSSFPLSPAPFLFSLL